MTPAVTPGNTERRTVQWVTDKIRARGAWDTCATYMHGGKGGLPNGKETVFSIKFIEGADFSFSVTVHPVTHFPGGMTKDGGTHVFQINDKETTAEMHRLLNELSIIRDIPSAREIAKRIQLLILTKFGERFPHTRTLTKPPSGTDAQPSFRRMKHFTIV